jgi:hypothetical protein
MQNSLASWRQRSDPCRDANITTQGNQTMNTQLNEAETSQHNPATPASGNPKPKATKKATGTPQKPRVAPPKAKKATKSQESAAPREGSKTAQVVALLQRKNGATLAEIMGATSWQAHSVRGFISGTLNKKMRLTVISAKREEGERAYSIPK